MKIPLMFDDEKALQTFPTGATLFSVGEPGDVMYVVKSGEIEILIGDQVVDTIGVDGIIGEMAILDNAPRSATAKTKSESVVLPLTQKQFIFMVQETPFFAIEVMRVMSARIRNRNSA